MSSVVWSDESCCGLNLALLLIIITPGLTLQTMSWTGPDHSLNSAKLSGSSEKTHTTSFLLNARVSGEETQTQTCLFVSCLSGISTIFNYDSYSNSVFSLCVWRSWRELNRKHTKKSSSGVDAAVFIEMKIMQSLFNLPAETEENILDLLLLHFL